MINGTLLLLLLSVVCAAWSNAVCPWHRLGAAPMAPRTRCCHGGYRAAYPWLWSSPPRPELSGAHRAVRCTSEQPLLCREVSHNTQRQRTTYQRSLLFVFQQLNLRFELQVQPGQPARARSWLVTPLSLSVSMPASVLRPKNVVLKTAIAILQFSMSEQARLSKLLLLSCNEKQLNKLLRELSG